MSIRSIHKIIICIGIVLFFTYGCTAIKQASVDAKTCLADPACREEAVAIAKSTKEQAVAVSGVSPIPLSTNVVGGVAYGAALLFALIRGGRRKRDEVRS